MANQIAVITYEAIKHDMKVNKGETIENIISFLQAINIVRV